MQKWVLGAATVVVLAAVGYYQLIYIPGEEEARVVADNAVAAQAAQAEAEDAAQAAQAAAADESASEAAANAAAAADAATAAASDASAEAQSALDEAGSSPAAQDAAAAAAEAADRAQAAAQAATQAAAQAVGQLSPADLFTVENYDPELANSYIDARDIPDQAKQTLKDALSAAGQTPEALEAALVSVRQALGL